MAKLEFFFLLFPPQPCMVFSLPCPALPFLFFLWNWKQKLIRENKMKTTEWKRKEKRHLPGFFLCLARDTKTWIIQMKAMEMMTDGARTDRCKSLFHFAEREPSREFLEVCTLCLPHIPVLNLPDYTPPPHPNHIQCMLHFHRNSATC